MTFVRPFIRLILCIVVLTAAAASLQAKADDWPMPAEWDQKYPFDGPNHADFYKLASVRAALVKLVGEQFYRRVILAWTEALPIKATGDSMIVWGCKPHGCQNEQVATLIQGRKTTVCVYYDSIPAPSEPVPEAAKSSSPPAYAMRLWYFAGAGSPLIERNPADAEECQFESIEDAGRKLEYARSLAQ